MPCKREVVKRVFQMGFCTDGLLEIYRRVPRPRHDGEFFLAFRKKRARKVLPLFSGITAFGAKLAIEDFRNRRNDLTRLLLRIGEKLKSTPMVPIQIVK